ncbi:hypothetical protein ACA910_022430 [Epithemia clementina (nom. ined.)]
MMMTKMGGCHCNDGRILKVILITGWMACWFASAAVEAFVISPVPLLKHHHAAVHVQRHVPTIASPPPPTTRSFVCYYSLVNSPVERVSSNRESIFNLNNKGKNVVNNPATTAIPFEIERLPAQPSESVFKEISQMCINAFFNDGETGRKVHFWKEWQLSYLRSLQQSDLRVRRRRYPETNMMFIAREVIPVTDENAWMVQQKSPLILDLSQVYNLPRDPKAAPGFTGDYVQGDVLGFVEVTLRPYGLGLEQVGMDDESCIQLRTNPMHKKRPILTNLSVKYEARKSGVGTRLMERCEQEIIRNWPCKSELILEVESDNVNALQFYHKRGFQELFEDPAGRRYDTNGFLLRQLRCCRKVLRKDLSAASNTLRLGAIGLTAGASAVVGAIAGASGGGRGDGGLMDAVTNSSYVEVATKAFQRLRNSFSFLQG